MKQKQKGFTLVELVVGLLVIGIALYALISVFTSIVPRDINVRTLSLATHLMNKKIEEVTLKSFNSIASSAAAAFPSPFGDYYNAVEVSYVTTAEPDVVATGVTNYKRIKVSVWGPQMGSKEVVTLVVTYEVVK